MMHRDATKAKSTHALARSEDFSAKVLACTMRGAETSGTKIRSKAVFCDVTADAAEPDLA